MPQFRADRAAIFLSDVLAPQHLVTLVLLSAPLRDAQTQFGHSLIAAVFVTGIPILTLWWMRRTGRVDDRHVSSRRRRLPLFTVSLLSLLAGLALLVSSGVSTVLMREVLAVLAGLVICMLVNHWWKISVHTAVAIAAGLIMLPVHAGIALGAVTGWARVRSRAHTASQATGGLLVGTLVHAGLTYLP